MSADIWLGAATTLAGAGLGGAISLALNRQQMRDARKQRAEDDERLKNRLSLDRRFDAYTNFSTCLRSYRDSIRGLEDPSAGQVSIDNIDTCARSANTASALVFFTVERQATYQACRAVVRSILNAQTALHNGDRSQEIWAEFNIEISALVREFQVAARDELGVGSMDPSVFFGRKIPVHRRQPAHVEGEQSLAPGDGTHLAAPNTAVE
jgi:hypothetical protein